MVTTKVAVYHPSLACEYVDLLAPRFPELAFLPATNTEEAVEAIAEAEILLTQAAIPGEVLSQCPNLKWIQVLAAGVERIVPFVPRDVRLSRLTGSFGKRMAEYALGYVLAITQRIPEVLNQQANREWTPLALDVAYGKTIGVAGLGSIGADVARLGSRMGMNVTAFSRSRPSIPEVGEWFDASSMEAFLGSADFVVLAMPATNATHHIVNERGLESMRPGSWLINLSRGSLVDESALIEGLRKHQPRGAVLDVFATEPLPAESPLWSMPNVIVTPHHSGSSLPTEAADLFAANLPRYRLSNPLVNEVDLIRGY